MTVGIDLRCLAEPYGSGVATYTRRMLTELVATAPDVRYVVFCSGIKAGRPQLPQGHIEYRQLRVPNRWLNLSFTLTGHPTIEQCFKAVDIVWQPNPLFIGTGTIPTWVTVHDLSGSRFPEFFSWHTRWWYQRWVHNFFLRAPRHVELIAVSEHTRRDILAYYPQWRDRVTVLAAPPPGPAAFNDHKRNCVTGKSEPYILAVMTLEVRKNIGGLLEGFARFHKRAPEFSLKIVGASGYLSRHDLNLLKNLGAKGIIETVGYVDESVRDELYAHSFCVVYPSFEEGYGYPPLEAFASGRPAVVAAAGALPEVLRDAPLYIDPYNAATEIAAALEVLLTDESVYSRCIKRGQDRLEELRSLFTVQPLIDLWQRRSLV